MPQINTPIYGDMMIEVQVETPVNLTKAQKEKIRSLGEDFGERHTPQSSGFFSRVKDLWDDLTD
jgi:molecular chaperone DnaJ